MEKITPVKYIENKMNLGLIFCLSFIYPKDSLCYLIFLIGMFWANCRENSLLYLNECSITGIKYNYLYLKPVPLFCIASLSL